MTHWTRWAQCLTMSLLISLSTGCGPPANGAQLPNRIDLERAQAIWTDPWLAPSETRTAGASPEKETGPTQIVARGDAAMRGSSASIQGAELATAEERGWRLVGLECTDEFWKEFTLVFERGDSTTTQARTTFSYSQVDPNLPHDSSKNLWVRGMEVRVPHHLEDPWPAAPSISLSNGCGTTPQLPQTRGLGSNDSSVPVPDWPSTMTQESGQTLVDQVKTDAFLSRVGTRIAQTPRIGDTVSTTYNQPQAQPVTLPDSASLTELSLEAAHQGYILSYASCGLGRSVAELRRSLETHQVIVRLTAEPDPQLGTRTIARALISRSELGGPTDQPSTITDPCWASPNPPEKFVSAGQPWYGPTSIQRMTS